MRYSLNAPAGAQLPPVLAERYKTADGAALKVALLFLEQPQADCETVCRVLNMTEAVAQRALNYWVSAGLLVTGEGKPAGAGRYTVEMFARSSLNDPELSVLLREAQRLLGRPTAHRENLMLAALYDAEGLPVEFILFVLEYSRRLAEAGSEVNYADRVARRWQKAGIVTLPQAEDYVRGLERQERQQSEVAAAIGRAGDRFTARERRMIDDWSQKFGYDASFAAEAAAQSGKNDIAYLHAMLSGWHRQGFCTLRQTRQTPGNIAARGRGGSGDRSLFDEANEKY